MLLWLESRLWVRRYWQPESHLASSTASSLSSLSTTPKVIEQIRQLLVFAQTLCPRTWLSPCRTMRISILSPRKDAHLGRFGKLKRISSQLSCHAIKILSFPSEYELKPQVISLCLIGTARYMAHRTRGRERPKSTTSDPSVQIARRSPLRGRIFASNPWTWSTTQRPSMKRAPKPATWATARALSIQAAH